jgi:hypothetical protein
VNLFLVGGRPDALRDVVARLPFFPGRSVQTAGPATWVAHTDEYVHVGDDGIAMYSGRPIVWSSAGNPLDARFWLDPHDLDGRYVGVRIVNDEVTVFADALGAYPVYRRRDGAVSNNAFALRESSSMRLDVLASLLGGGWSLSGDPVWEGVERIPPERPDRPMDPFDPDRAASILVATVRALADWPGRPSVVPVTAGRDSRLVLAAALAAGIEFETTTGGEPGHPDAEIGRRLAEVAGVPWKPIEHDPHGSVESDWRRAAELLWLASSGTASLGDAAGFPHGPRPGPLPLWHSGQGGEIARHYYGSGSGDADLLYRRFVGRRPGRAEILNAEGERLLRAQVKEFARGQRADDMRDLFYLHVRMGTWAGPTHGAVEFVRDTTSPLWSRKLLPDLWAGRGRFHDEVLERLAPQLATVPYERTPTLPRKVVAALKRRLSADDPFARILPEIREAVLAQPQHAAWHVLDRARVEELLAAAPRTLDTMSRYYVWRLATVFGPSA